MLSTDAGVVAEDSEDEVVDVVTKTVETAVEDMVWPSVVSELQLII